MVKQNLLIGIRREKEIHLSQKVIKFVGVIY